MTADYNQRPTFFGCNETGQTPLVIYLPPSPDAQRQYGYTTNTSTYQLEVRRSELARHTEEAADAARSTRTRTCSLS